MNRKKIIMAVCLIVCFVSVAAPVRMRVMGASKDADDEVAAAQKDMGDVAGTGGFVIDNQNIYEGMEKSYSSGYMPKTDGKKAVVVLPLLAKRKILENRMTVTLRFGESENLPFVQKNYEKTVSYGMYNTKNRTEPSGCYLVTFDLELKKDRCNGNYPVTLSVSAEEEAGNEISQEFVVYVAISDGKQPDISGSDGDAQGTGGANAAAFAIDNKHVYQGMEKSYSRGYTPKTEGTKAVIVLPLQAKCALAGKKLTAALKTGDSGSQPFVQKNYEKTVRFGYHTAGKKARAAKSGKKVGCYLVTFNLKLKKERDNGSYPVTISVNAEDRNGNAVSQEFTVFVSIMDGRGAEGGGDRGRTPSFAPKIILASCQFSKDRILCGKKYKAEIFLKNTSTEKGIKNMTVTLVPGEHIELTGKTGSTYVKELGNGGKCCVPFNFQVNADAPAGQYSVGVKLDYADSSGNTYTAEEEVRISAEQKVRIGIDPVQVPKEIQLGDSMVLQTQAVNLGKGKLYNIRAVLEADGLSPVSSAYMGDAEAGAPLSGSMEVVAEGLSGDSLYGNTQGKVIFYYEDESGKEMTQVQDFETAILSPLKGDEEEKPEDNTDQWWVIMAVIMIFSGVAAVSFFVNKKRTAQRGDPDEN